MENERHDGGVAGSVVRQGAASDRGAVSQGAVHPAGPGVGAGDFDGKSATQPVQTKGFFALTMPTVGGIAGLAFLAVLVIFGGGDSLATFLWGLMFLFFVLPCALVGALICGACLAGSRSRRGAGTVALAALGAAVGIPLLWAAISIVFN